MSSANTQTYVALLKKRISRDIARLREITVDPVDIKFAENLSFEVRPNPEDDRINIYRKNWGGITVNYTKEGVIVDVFAQDSVESLYTRSVPSEDLTTP